MAAFVFSREYGFARSLTGKELTQRRKVEKKDAKGFYIHFLRLCVPCIFALGLYFIAIVTSALFRRGALARTLTMPGVWLART